MTDFPKELPIDVRPVLPTIPDAPSIPDIPSIPPFPPNPLGPSLPSGGSAGRGMSDTFGEAEGRVREAQTQLGGIIDKSVMEITTPKFVALSTQIALMQSQILVLQRLVASLGGRSGGTSSTPPRIPSSGVPVGSDSGGTSGGNGGVGTPGEGTTESGEITPTNPSGPNQT